MLLGRITHHHSHTCRPARLDNVSLKYEWASKGHLPSVLSGYLFPAHRVSKKGGRRLMLTVHDRGMEDQHCWDTHAHTHTFTWFQHAQEVTRLAQYSSCLASRTSSTPSLRVQGRIRVKSIVLHQYHLFRHQILYMLLKCPTHVRTCQVPPHIPYPQVPIKSYPVFHFLAHCSYHHVLQMLLQCLQMPVKTRHLPHHFSYPRVHPVFHPHHSCQWNTLLKPLHMLVVILMPWSKFQGIFPAFQTLRRQQERFCRRLQELRRRCLVTPSLRFSKRDLKTLLLLQASTTRRYWEVNKYFVPLQAKEGC